MPDQVKTLAQFEAELDAKFAKLEQRVKALENGFGELKGLLKDKPDGDHRHGLSGGGITGNVKGA